MVALAVARGPARVASTPATPAVAAMPPGLARAAAETPVARCPGARRTRPPVARAASACGRTQATVGLAVKPVRQVSSARTSTAVARSRASAAMVRSAAVRRAGVVVKGAGAKSERSARLRVATARATAVQLAVTVRPAATRGASISAPASRAAALAGMPARAGRPATTGSVSELGAALGRPPAQRAAAAPTRPAPLRRARPGPPPGRSGG